MFGILYLYIYIYVYICISTYILCSYLLYSFKYCTSVLSLGFMGLGLAWRFGV